MYVRRCTGFQHLILNLGQKVDRQRSTTVQGSSSDLFHNQFVTCRCVCVVCFQERTHIRTNYDELSLPMWRAALDLAVRTEGQPHEHRRMISLTHYHRWKIR